MTRDQLIAQAEALEWAFRSNPYGYMKPLTEVNARIAELRAQAESMPDAKAANYDWMEEARQLAAQCWCDPETAQTQMDVVLAEAIARRIAAWMQTGAFYARNEEYWRERALKAEAMPAQPDLSARVKKLESLLRSTLERANRHEIGVLDPVRTCGGGCYTFWDELSAALAEGE